MPASPSGIRIRAGMSKSVNDAESSVSMCSLYSSYLSNEESIVGVCIIMRKVKSEGNHPSPSQTNKTKEELTPHGIIDSAKLTLYFRLSNTLRTASVAISGVTEI